LSIKLYLSAQAVNKKNKIFSLSILFMFGFSLMVFASAPVFAAKGPQCAPRFIAQNIQLAVFALKATQNCKGIALPYSAAQASMQVDSLRCGAQASDLIDELIKDYNGKYKMIMSGTSKQVTCKQAASMTLGNY